MWPTAARCLGGFHASLLRLGAATARRRDAQAILFDDPEPEDEPKPEDEPGTLYVGEDD
jgi:hypothetical protein